MPEKTIQDLDHKEVQPSAVITTILNIIYSTELISFYTLSMDLLDVHKLYL